MCLDKVSWYCKHVETQPPQRFASHLALFPGTGTRTFSKFFFRFSTCTPGKSRATMTFGTFMQPPDGSRKLAQVVSDRNNVITYKFCALSFFNKDRYWNGPQRQISIPRPGGSWPRSVTITNYKYTKLWRNKMQMKCNWRFCRCNGLSPGNSTYYITTMVNEDLASCVEPWHQQAWYWPS